MTAAVLAAFAVSAATAAAEPRFTASRIPLPAVWSGPWTGRLDGDDRADLVVAAGREDGSRELSIHLQRPDGSFPPVPDRRVVLKSDIVAFSIADVRPDPGEEILFFTAGACFSYSTAREEFAGNARKVFSFDLLVDLPDPKGPVFVPAHRGAGGPLWVLPGPRGCAAFGPLPAGPAGDIVLRGTIPAALIEKDRGDEWPRRTGAGEPRDPFPGLVVLPGGPEGEGRLLEVDRWTPFPVLADADGDGREDVLVLDRAAGRRLSIYLQGPDGKFPAAPSWTAPFPGDGPLTAVDWDGDRRVDLIAGEPEGSDSQLLRFYRNRGGRFEPGTPDGAMKFSGYGVKARVIDLDGDGRPELAVSSYEVPVAGAVAGGRVVRSLFVYRSEPGGAFARRPALRREESFTARDFKGIGLPVDFGADLLGRGARDALSVDRDGALAARRLDRDLTLEEEAFFRFAPEKWILGFDAADLNGDGRSDLIIRHTGLLTILVSKP